MNYAELLAYLEAYWIKTTLRSPVGEYPFARLRALLGRFGDPDRRLACVGVTGSKGKGSIARMLAAVLEAHGLKVGLFTSPHLVRVEERIQLDGRTLPPEAFAERFGKALAEQRAGGMEDLGVTPLLLAMGLAWFRDEQADAAVLEVRAGGRFDPTNVAASRIVCIGPIGLEHVPGLGHSLADIAWQKVGLAQPGGACFSARQPPEAEAVIERECASLGARLFRLGRDFDYRVVAPDECGQMVDLRTPRASFADLRLGLLGEHQAANAAVALAAAEAVLSGVGGRGIADRPPPPDPGLQRSRVATALRAVRWPARLERLSSEPPVFYDGAHTPESAAALASALADHFPGRRWSFVLGVLGKKNAPAILRALGGVAARVRCVPIPGFDHRPPAELVEQARAAGLDAAANSDLDAALADLAGFAEPICITGTLYLYAEARRAFPEELEQTARAPRSGR